VSGQFEARDLCVRHPGARTDSPCILKDFSISIAAGEQLAIIGPSGAGKTTLLHTLALANAPDKGLLRVFDQNPWELSAGQRHSMRRRLFLAPQVPPLPPRQRVVTAVLAGKLPLWSFRKSVASLLRPTELEQAHQALTAFNLQDKMFSRVDRLSGGERQRCGLARLLVSQAQALFVDEPLSALDPTLALQTIRVLMQHASERDTTLVCSLHHVDIALAHFPRIVGLRDGRVFFDKPRTQVSERDVAALYENEVSSAPAAWQDQITALPAASAACR
jgi:phosphonate transport system ATP-binding protein